ncbi:MAG TPA: divergent PAP2 family protein [Candidatus Saccharimonadales bacterium]
MYLIAAACGWAVAQICKYLLVSLKSKSFRDLTYLYKSGSMPSVHAATIVAVTTYIGLVDGFSSGLFALALIVSFVVLYDAVQVRRAVGEQGLAIIKLLEKDKKLPLPHHAMGHTPLEMLAGTAIGVLVALLLHFL